MGLEEILFFCFAHRMLEPAWDSALGRGLMVCLWHCTEAGSQPRRLAAPRVKQEPRYPFEAQSASASASMTARRE
jgi:hypothetical protein